MNNPDNHLPSIADNYRKRGWLKPTTDYKEKNFALIERWRNGEDVFEEIYALNLCLIRKIILHYSKKGISEDDLYQQAALVVYQCLQSFDPHRYTDFKYYLSPALNNAFKRMIFTQVPLIRIQESAFQNVREALDVAQKQGRSAETVVRESNGNLPPSSLPFITRQISSGLHAAYLTSMPDESDDRSVYDLKTTSSPEDQVNHQLYLAQIRRIIEETSVLTDVERLIIYYTYFEELNQTEIAQQLAEKGYTLYTRQNISLIQSRARKKLAKVLINEDF